jgi:hypothetical protein
LFGIVFNIKKPFLQSTIETSDLVWSARFFPFIIKNDITKIIFFLTTLASILINVISKKNIFKFICSTLVVTYFGFCYSHGKIPHSNHAWIYACMLMSFFDRRDLIDNRKNYIVIRLIQTTILLSYFLAGYWKATRALQYDGNVYDFAMRSIAVSIAQGRDSFSFIPEIITNHPLVISGFILTVLFQLSTIIPIIFNKYFKAYGILIVLFHCMTGFMMNIWFKNTIFAVIFFFIIIEFFYIRHYKLNIKSTIK